MLTSLLLLLLLLCILYLKVKWHQLFIQNGHFLQMLIHFIQLFTYYYNLGDDDDDYPFSSHLLDHP